MRRKRWRRKRQPEQRRVTRRKTDGPQYQTFSSLPNQRSVVLPTPTNSIGLPLSKTFVVQARTHRLLSLPTVTPRTMSPFGTKPNLHHRHVHNHSLNLSIFCPRHSTRRSLCPSTSRLAALPSYHHPSRRGQVQLTPTPHHLAHHLRSAIRSTTPNDERAATHCCLQAKVTLHP